MNIKVNADLADVGPGAHAADSGGKLTVFIDESGDLGFGPRSSKSFVVAFLTSEDPDRLNVNMKRLLKGVNKMLKPHRRIQELKFSDSSAEVKERVLRRMAAMESISFITCAGIASKDSVKPELRDKPNTLYNYMTLHYVLEGIMKTRRPDVLELVIDRSLPKEAQRRFDEYAEKKVKWLSDSMSVEPPDLRIKPVNSMDTGGVQAADFAAGAIRRYMEGEPHFYYLIEGKVRRDLCRIWGDSRNA